MPFIEQLYYGLNLEEPSFGHQVLAHSPGVGKDAAQEIKQLCEGWGPIPPLGLSHQALMSFPLDASMASLRGQLYVVIRVCQGQVPVFHALIVNDADYASFGHNPFALVSGIPVDATWSPGQSLGRVKITPGSVNVIISPLPSPEDVGIVDLIIEQALSVGRAVLPLEDANSKSDRTLALVLAALPKGFLRKLRFSSFSIAQTNNYSLVAVQTPGSTFAGWKRILLAKVIGKVSAENAQYVHKVRAYLDVGNLDGLRDLDLGPNVGKQVPAPPIQQPAKPKVSIVTAAPGPWDKPQRQLSKVSTRPSGQRKVMPGSRPVRSRRGYVNLSRFLMLVFAVVLVGSGGIWWLKQDGIIGLEAWSGLPGFTQNENRGAKAQTLLEVVDSGKVYDRLVSKLAQASMGKVDQASRNRYQALAKLQSDAAGPLTQQAELFLKLAGDGIQQSSRQDREADRLQALATQGAVLESELKRLELAWISLSTAEDWRDLSHLSDKNISARRDSLSKKNAHSLKTAGQELGTTGLVKNVAAARIETEGMADLLGLFRAEVWTMGWETALPRAAKKVSPSASKMTRAYRNSAYALVRLKEAERSTLAEGVAFSEKFGTEAWLPYDVVELLPSLRREIGRFPGGEAPVILAGILSMYSTLQKTSGVDFLKFCDSATLEKLEKNRALNFDPAAYGDLVNRIRFEAARSQLAQGTDPMDLPEAFFVEGNRAATVGFITALGENHNQAEWQFLANTTNMAFFRRWAMANGKNAAAKKEQLVAGFSDDWKQLRQLSGTVSRLAAEGRDWTAHWHDLQDKVTAMQSQYSLDHVSDCGSIATKIMVLETLSKQLDYSGLVSVIGVVVRLNPDVSFSDNKVIVSLIKVDGEGVGEPLVLQLGPAAPSGSGWVGAGELNWRFLLSKDESLVARVTDSGSGNVLQEIVYGSLVERVGSGALSRTRNLKNGSLSFKTDSGYWMGLVLPELP